MSKIIFAFLLIPFFGNAQLAKKVIDEYTGEVRYESEWAKLNESTWTAGYLAYVRFHFVDSSFVFELKTTTQGSVVSIDKGADFHIKFTDGSVIELTNEEYAITSIGEGAIGMSGSEALGLNLFFVVDRGTIEAISEKSIEKCRLMTSGGPMEIIPSKRKFPEDVSLKAKHLLLLLE